MFVLRKPPPPLPEATVVIISRILARYQACHVIYQLNISSMNLWLADKKITQLDSESGFLIGWLNSHKFMEEI